MFMSTVSIIIPIYNAEKYLRRCLDALKWQTFDDWEAVCVNDGSRDGSAKILSEYAAQDARFRIITRPNGGVAEARNSGLAAAEGEYIMFVDPDDFIHPQTLEIAVGLSRRDSTDIVCWTYDRAYRQEVLTLGKAGGETLDFRPESLSRRFTIDDVRRKVTYDMVSHLTEMEDPKSVEWPIRHFYLWQFLFRSSLVKDLRFLKELRIYEDFPWLCEIPLRDPSVTITELPLYYYYPNASSIDMSTGGGSLRTRCLITGLLHCSRLYKRADASHARAWSRLCKWPMIRFQLRRNLELSSPADHKRLRASLRKLHRLGAFDAPPDLGYWICRYRIYRFMNIV